MTNPDNQLSHGLDSLGAFPEPFAAALAAVMADLFADPQVQAVFLGGSVALGRASDRSDIDLVVIKGAGVDVMERYVRYECGVQVQVIAGPPRQFDIWLENDRPAGTVIRQLADGKLLFDRGGLGARYKALADEVIAAGLEPMTEQQVLSRRFLLTELLDDLADCSGKALEARWLMHSGLGFVVETAFLWHRCWTPKGKWALAEIDALDGELASAVRAYLGAPGPQQRAAFESLVGYVLGCLGGQLREPWARPPEAVPNVE